MERLRIGWVGAGFVGQVAHLANYVELPNAEVVALAERRPELGKKVCTKWGIPRLYSDHHALLRDPDVDAVVAVVRREHTASVALDVLKGRKHLFTEKPMAATLEQASRLVEAANGLRYAVGFMRRHDEGAQIGKRLLDELRASEELGPVIYARFYCFAGYDWCNIGGAVATEEPRPDELFLPLAPDWIDPALHREFDWFNNVYSHDLNFIRYIFGQRPTVEHVHYRKPTISVATLAFDGFPGVFEFGPMDQYRWEEGVDVYFQRGRLRIELPPAMLRNVPSRVELYKDKGSGQREVVSPQAEWTWAFRRQAEAFVDDVRLGREPLASGADSLEDMRFLEDFWRRIVS
ncbi:MAG TPA: Gfo/Idh/MocA family oxidoreductase [Chloroflexota bacterium]